MTMNRFPRPYDQKIALRLKLQPAQVAAAIKLFDEGNTLPFIARYRKEMTHSLDEDQLRQLSDLLAQMRALDDRREAVLESIESQGQLTPELEKKILAADTMTALEDLYQPFKPKRRTRAAIARERGLEPLAHMILAQARSANPETAAKTYLNDEVPTTADALAGARDIVAEVISDDPDVRSSVREKAMRFGGFAVEKVKDAVDEKGVYSLYYQFQGRIDRLKPYQMLAINRGETEKILRVRIDIPERDWRGAVEHFYRIDPRSPFADELAAAQQDAADRLLLPAIERDVRRTLSEAAEAHAIQVFAANLRGLLSQPPLAGRVVLGVDPAYRTGCKLAVVDPTGKVLDTDAIFPHEPRRDWQGSLNRLALLVKKHGVTLISIGNGTASRETEQLIAELTRNLDGVYYLMVNEAGASVYSASAQARAELPDLDVTLRGAVSIARRALDPLAELVKIDPKAIGVGLYQHDVDQKALSAALDGVVESVVNRVGVDVNTASAALLTHVAGIGAKLAEKIVAYRDENGTFTNRKQLKKVPALGPKAFEQAAGFLRVRGGENPLDSSAIHPESYPVAEAVLKKAGVKPKDAPTDREARIDALRQTQPVAALAAELDTGVPTLVDILEQLLRPGRDPREDAPLPLLRSDVLSVDDLKTGMHLNGTVRNVVDFGAFIDIGVKQDGLLHISQIPRGTTLGIGDVLEVQIVSIDTARGRIGLGWTESS